MKLTRRRVWGLLIVFVVVVAFIVLWNVEFRTDGITQANVDRIQIGMTLAQVTAILGPPTYSSPPVDYRWEGINGSAMVHFHDDGVRRKTYSPNQVTFWVRVKRLFGL